MEQSGKDAEHFEYPTYVLSQIEYAKIVSEINTAYGLYANSRYCIHSSVGPDGRYYLYYFENHGYGMYNIYGKFEF